MENKWLNRHQMFVALTFFSVALAHFTFYSSIRSFPFFYILCVSQFGKKYLYNSLEYLPFHWILTRIKVVTSVEYNIFPLIYIYVFRTSKIWFGFNQQQSIHFFFFFWTFIDSSIMINKCYIRFHTVYCV